jgi:hypothetical protein
LRKHAEGGEHDEEEMAVEKVTRVLIPIPFIMKVATKGHAMAH